MRKIKDNRERCRFNVVEKRSKARHSDTAYLKAERIMKNCWEFAQLFFGEEGTAAIEFGLIGTFLSLLFIGLVDFGMGYWEQMQVGNAVRAATEYAIAQLHHGLAGADAKLRVPHRVWRHYHGERDTPDLRCELRGRRDRRRLCHRQCKGVLFDDLGLSGTCQPNYTDRQHDGPVQLKSRSNHDLWTRQASHPRQRSHRRTGEGMRRRHRCRGRHGSSCVPPLAFCRSPSSRYRIYTRRVFR
jgi:Flp pilus assembly pilin Flp